MNAKKKEKVTKSLYELCNVGRTHIIDGYVTIQEKLKRLRNNMGLTQSQLAKKCHVTENDIQDWEQGKNIPSIDNLISLADVFGVSLDVFRQDVRSLNLRYPNKRLHVKNKKLSYNGIPLIFDSVEPNNWQKYILNFCSSYFEVLNKQFFIQGPGLNSEFGVGRFFWEKNLNILMFIGFFPMGNAISRNRKTDTNFSFCIGVNTEIPPSEEALKNIRCLQVGYGYINLRLWVFVPIKYPVKKENGMFSEQLMEATNNTLVTAMKISRLSLESTLQRFIKSSNERK